MTETKTETPAERRHRLYGLNMGQKKPHLLHVEFDVVGSYHMLKYRVECPNETESADARSCASYVECTPSDPACKDHLRPEEPDVPEPQGKYRDGKMHYPEGTDPAHIKAWDDYERVLDEWNDEHPEGPYHPTDECWIKDYVAQGYEDGFELSDEFDGTPVVSPLKVYWTNRGQIDDSFVELHPWEEITGGEEAQHA